MDDLPLRPVGRGKIGEVCEPVVTHSGFQHEAQGHDLVVQCAARRRLVDRRRALGFLWGTQAADRRGGRPMDPVFLHLAGGDLGDAKLAEERQEVQAKADFVAFNPARAALALGDDAVFLEELVGGLLDGLFGLEQAGAGFAAQFEIPVLGEVGREGEGLLFRRGAALLAPDGGGARPGATVAAAVELNLATKDAVSGLSGHVTACKPAGWVGGAGCAKMC